MTQWDISHGLTSPRAILQRPSMETPKHQFNTRVCTSPVDTSAPSATAFVVKPPIRTPDTVAPPKAPEMNLDRPRLLWSTTAELKPMAHGSRKVPPFGSFRREGRHEQTKRSTGGVARSQVDPPHGRTGGRVHRNSRFRDRSPHWPLSDRQPRLSENRLNGCPEALAEVLRHRIRGGGRRVPDPAPKDFRDARFVAEPAYSLGPHSVSPLRRLAGGRAPSDPRNGNGAP